MNCRALKWIEPVRGGNCRCLLGNAVWLLMAVSGRAWLCSSSSTKGTAALVEGSWRTCLFAYHGTNQTHTCVLWEQSCSGAGQAWSHVARPTWQDHSANRCCLALETPRRCYNHSNLFILTLQGDVVISCWSS